MKCNVGDVSLEIPEGYTQIDDEEVPPECVAFFTQTPSANCAVQLQPSGRDECMPFDEPQVVIDGIHGALGEKQGLVDVKAGSEKQGRFIYSIVKSQNEPSGMLYILTMDLEVSTHYVRLQGWFNEAGTTGIRDSTVFAMRLKSNLSDFERIHEGWVQDPYDKDFVRGALMNESEKEEFDEAFPDHPLSVARRFASDIVKANLH